jgi:hypothetical protein
VVSSLTCEGSPLNGSPSKMNSWNNCKGTYTTANGNKYLGERKSGKKMDMESLSMQIALYTSVNGSVTKGTDKAPTLLLMEQ